MSPSNQRSGGENTPVTSLVWGDKAGRGATIPSRSPLDGSLLGETPQLDENELSSLLAPLGSPFNISPEEIGAFSRRLHSELEGMSAQIFEALQRETGFISADCREVRNGILKFVRDFCDVGYQAYSEPPSQSYGASGSRRSVRLVAAPWGTVAVVLPSSAALLLAVTCLFNALATGTRVILRFPAACPLSADIFCQALLRAQPPADAVSAVMVPAKQLMGAIHRSSAPILIHYLGSSGNVPKLFSEGFENRNPVIADGEGNTWVWVAEDANPEKVADILTNGALRYNGQTCTSINGALIDPALYDTVREALVARWKTLVSGDPKDEGTKVGPLTNDDQVQWCMERIQSSGGDQLCGGQCEGALLCPTLVEAPDPNSELVTHGIFGPVLWLASATQEEFRQRWRTNRYPLCAGILTSTPKDTTWAANLGNVARVVINDDPSIEWIFEPWGGYPATGNNPISTWANKYRRIVALDEPGNA